MRRGPRRRGAPAATSDPHPCPTRPSSAARLALRARLNDAPGASIDDEGGAGGATYVVDVTCDPGLYRVLEEEVGRVEGGGSLEVLSLRAAAGDDGGAGGGHGGSGGADDDDDLRDVAARPVGSGSSGAGARAAVSGAVSTDAVAAAARGTGMVVRRVTQPGARLHCNSCDVHFDGPEAHRAHFRADLHRWVGGRAGRSSIVAPSFARCRVPPCVDHRYNLKRKMRAQPPIPETEFAALSAAAIAAVLDALE